MTEDQAIRTYVYNARQYGSKISRRIQLYMICDIAIDYVWRVEVRGNDSVKLEYIGYIPIPGDRVKVYSTLDKAPEWVQDRLAVLRLMKADPIESAVYGVGRRVAENSFWIVLPRELHGVDT